MTVSASQGQGRPTSGQSALRNWTITLGVNVVLPIATYFVLTRSVGMSEVPALVISGVWPVAELAWTFARERQADEFSLFVLLGIVVGIVLAVTSDSSRALFLKDSITTGVIGLAILVSLAMGRPLTFFLGRRFATDGSRVQREWWNGLWQFPRFRQVQRRLAVVWGVSLLGEAVVRAILTRQLGTSSMVVVNNVVPYAVIAVLIGYSVLTGRREREAAERRNLVGATPPAG